jgi:hypothetical protein
MSQDEVSVTGDRKPNRSAQKKSRECRHLCVLIGGHRRPGSGLGRLGAEFGQVRAEFLQLLLIAQALEDVAGPQPRGACLLHLSSPGVRDADLLQILRLTVFVAGLAVDGQRLRQQDGSRSGAAQFQMGAAEVVLGITLQADPPLSRATASASSDVAMASAY